MSNKEVPDIGEMLKFWEMKAEIWCAIQRALEWDLDDEDKKDKEEWFIDLMVKIESLGKKDSSNE
jgi:hypothetical protein